MRQNLHFVFFTQAAFDGLMQRPQQLAMALEEAGIAVTFVNPVSNPLSLWVRRQLTRNAPRRHPGIRVVDIPRWQIPLLRVPLLPLNTSPEKIQRYLGRTLASSLQGQCSVAFVDNPALFAYVPTEHFQMLCYDCMDDLDVITGGQAQRFMAEQQRLVRAADLIFISAENLHSEIARHAVGNIAPVSLPNGVAYDWFVRQASGSDAPAELEKMPRPRVGFVGSLSHWIDVPLILETARLLPDCSFVLIGPVAPEVRSELRQIPANVQIAGRIPYSAVPGAIAGFDVCMIPFKPGIIADTTDPIKLYEYFAMGRPVVCTPMKELLKYERDGLLVSAGDAETFARAIRASLEENTSERERQRTDLAFRNSWRNRAARLLAAVEGLQKCA